MNIITPVNATNAHQRMSHRYGFIPTHEIVRTMQKNQWLVTSEQSVRVRTPDRIGFQKHLLRFAHRTQLEMQKTERIEMVLLNSHDGTSTLRMSAGTFRLACTNGLIVSDATVAEVKLGHHRLTMEKVLHAADTMLAASDRVANVIADWRGKSISNDDALHLAEQGIILRWGELAKAPIAPRDALLTIRRDEDKGSNLWETFNRVQENIVRRGVGATRLRDNGRPYKTPRSLSSLDALVKVNKGLWQVASEIAMQA
jgi:hypothetical protein